MNKMHEMSSIHFQVFVLVFHEYKIPIINHCMYIYAKCIDIYNNMSDIL